MNDFNGLSNNTRRVKTPEGFWEFAKNIVLTRGYTSIANEEGNEFIDNVPGIVMGKIETNKETVFLSRDGEFSCIGYIDNEISNNYISVLRTINPYFRINLNCPIEGVYVYNYKKELIIVWCDGIKDDSNTPKILNIKTLPFEVDINKELINPDNITLLDLFPIRKEGIITTEYKSGSIQGDVIYITYTYVLNDNTELIYFPISTIAWTTRGIENIEKRGLKIIINNLDINYKKLRIGIVAKFENAIKAYTTNILEYTGNTIIYSLSGLSNLSLINIEELIIDKQIFNKIKTITKQNDQLLIGNLVTDKIDYSEWQKYFNLFQLVLDIDVNEENETNSTLMPDEVYSFYCEAQLLDGSYTPAFHIPAPKFATGSDWDSPIGSVRLNQLGLNDLDPNIKRYKIENNGRRTPFIWEFGTFYNEETYPFDDKYNSSTITGNNIDDLRGTPIRYHRLPGLDKICEYYLSTIGTKAMAKFKIKLVPYALLPIDIDSKIQSFRLSFVKRKRGESLVESNGLGVKNIEQGYEFEGISWTVLYNNIRFNTRTLIPNTNSTTHRQDYCRRDVLSDYSTFCFFNPEVNKNSPLLNVKIAKANYIKYLNPDNNLHLITDDIRYSIISEYNYYLPNNIAGKTRFTQNGLRIKSYNDSYRKTDNSGIPIIGGKIWQLSKPFVPLSDNFAYHFKFNSFNINTQSYEDVIKSDDDSNCRNIANITLLNIIDNCYTGFNPTDLIIYNKYEKNNNTFKLGGDVFPNNKLKASLITYVVTKDTNKVGCLYLNVEFQGFYSSYNNNILKGSIFTFGENNFLGLHSNSDLNTLNTQDYEIKTTTFSDSSHLNDLSTVIIVDNYKDFINYFPYRINRSSKIASEQLQLRSIRTFLVDDYYEMPTDKGEIVALRGTNNSVYIQQKYSLFLSSIKDKLNTSGSDTYLGTSELFDRFPDEIVYNSNKGYIGCSSQFACIIFKGGYATIDQIQGKLFIVNGNSPQEISMKNTKQWFIDNTDTGLEFFENDKFMNKQRVDNPFTSVGHIISFDEQYNRLLFTKKHYELINKDLLSNPQYSYKDGIYYNNNIPINLYNNPMFIDNSYTISYALEGQGSFVCLHDYLPNIMYYINKGLYSIVNNLNNNAVVYKHNSKVVNPSNFYGVQYKSYVDLIFNQRLDLSKIYQSFMWITEVFNNETGVVEYHNTIDGVYIYTDNQCSGFIDIKNGKYKVIRNTEYKWQLNEFRDLVKDYNLPFIDEKGNFLEDNINYNKVFFNKSNFLSNFIIIRMIINNEENKTVYIHNVNVKSEITKR